MIYFTVNIVNYFPHRQAFILDDHHSFDMGILGGRGLGIPGGGGGGPGGGGYTGGGYVHGGGGWGRWARVGGGGGAGGGGGRARSVTERRLFRCNFDRAQSRFSPFRAP